jgi:hypothetical protein
MKQFFLVLMIVLFSGCQKPKDTQIPDSSDEEAKESTMGEANVTAESEVLTADFLGIYHGIQPGYFMKNQFGDDLIINGNKVPIPSIDYKFLFKENRVVNLQQISLEDNRRVYYEGTYRIISEDSSIIKVECSLSDGDGSSPVYVLTINKTDKKGVCTGSNEPEFAVERSN